jgi:hypothetical protein
VNAETTKFKLIVKSANNQSTEYMKTVMKSRIKPIEMKIGISSLKSLQEVLGPEETQQEL